jgi:ATP-dependent Clp protease ATP-binding subunit ClpX
MSKCNDSCDFCHSPKETLKALLSNGLLDDDRALICISCATSCVKLFSEHVQHEAVEVVENPLPELVPSYTPKTPMEVKAEIDDYVIGQTDAKEKLAVALYNHYKRLKSVTKPDVEVNKSNILIIGPTGTGKTLLAESLAKSLDVPFAVGDATSLTQSGYVGEDVELIIHKLVMAANGDVKRAEKGIVYIDEIDKIAKMSSNSSVTRDISGEGVQQSLLKLIEGTVVNIATGGGKKNPSSETYPVDTRNILFICGGAFSGLGEIIKERLNKKNRIGFAPLIEESEKTPDFDENNPFGHVQPDDLVKFGLIPEFVGRLPVISKLHTLDNETLCSILTEPKNAIVKEYKYLFQEDDIILEITDSGLRAIADVAIKRKTGARGLRTIIEDVLGKTMYIAPNEKGLVKVVVNENSVIDNMPSYVYAEKSAVA